MDRTTFGDAVVSSHGQATQAGMDILSAGGNAIDAALAANAVLGVIAPEMCGVGGDLFALTHRPGLHKPLALNASGPAGAGADISELNGHATVPPNHPLSVTVPGCVQGWHQLAATLGRMPLSDTLVPAIRLATTGFPASSELSRSLMDRADELSSRQASEGLYLGRTAPRPGERLKRPSLARTLSDIASGGAEAFYEGVAGRSISDATGGRITTEDLAAYRAQWVDPLGLDVLGSTAWTVPPNSQGYVTLATLWIFEQLDAPSDPAEPAYHHALIEAYRAAVHDRDAVLADPDFGSWAGPELLEPSRLASRAAACDSNAISRWPAPSDRSGGTTFVAVVDRDGIAISLIQSNYHGIGSGIGAGTAGFFLHNRGVGFNLEPGHPNMLLAGKRPRHTLSPTLWTRDDELDLILGTRGGNQQPQLLAQVATHLRYANLTPPAAQHMARWAIRSDQAQGTITVEDGFPAKAFSGLRQLGYEIESAAVYEESFGPVSLISVDPSGLRTAASDPRVATSSAAVR